MTAQNRIQQAKIGRLEGRLNVLEASKARLEKQIGTLRSKGGVISAATAEEIAALGAAIDKKNALIAKMRDQLLAGGMKLPMELSVMLEDFAENNPMVTFDKETGKLKFKSDLLFELGSDKVAASAVSSIQAISGIMKTDEAKDFDVIIAGHTDDVPIGKPETRAKHPTNWHLSVHRAISVLNAMVKSGVKPTRLSVRGFGEYRPIAPNAPKNKGNAVNRRVEMFIVYKGA
jgi:chemotaxis protein MotB